MKRIRLFLQAMALLSAGFLASASGHARSAQPVQAPRPAITEFRGYGFIGWGLEDDIWRLAADGRATMIYVQRRGLGDRSGSGVEGGDEGTWSRRDGQICVEWRVRRDISGCYTIVQRGGIHVRLIGPVTYDGTIE